MDSAIENLVQLGLKEYEARIYVALVGLGETNVRRIHEVSGVPRPRVYDVLNALDEKGFIEIRQGSPLMYRAVRPDIVVSFLKKDLDAAASDSIRTLESLSVDTKQDYSPIWYVHSDWTIQRNLEMMVESVTRELIILCFDKDILVKFQEPVSSITSDRAVKILFPKGEAEGVIPLKGIKYFEAGLLEDFFSEKIFKKIFSAPIRRGGALFRLECILIADDQESMLIYSQNGKQMAVIITLPFITCVQSALFSWMIEQANEITGDKKSTSECKKRTVKKSHQKRIPMES
ncbi:MAG: TrmB family transcriptional regulator [Methanomicrobiales archaeon]|jgi:sugar-specific transcriptional regulator TrmB|nr:TrmB family transcriptional regulator [Methanomicrobiales archaeon]